MSDAPATGPTLTPPPPRLGPGRPPAQRPPVTYSPLAYSESRARRLRMCPRAYYFAYYLSAAGHGAPAGSPAWLAARLRRTTSLWAAVGTALHAAASTCARAARSGGALPPAPALRARAAATLNVLWAASRRGRREFMADPRRVPMLAEAIYGEGPDAGALARARARLDRGVAALADLTPLWTRLARPGADVRLPGRFFRFALAADGASCYAAPDLLVRPAARGRTPPPWAVVEFKTGRPDGAVDQVFSYCLAARDGFGLAPAPGPVSYTGLVVSLGAPPGSRVTAFGVAPSDLTEAEARIRMGVAAMRALLADPPAPAPRPIDAFPAAPSPARCPTCEFRVLCDPTRYPLDLGR